MRILNNTVSEQQEEEKAKEIVRNYVKGSYDKAKSQIEKCPVCGSKRVKIRIESGQNDYFADTFHIYGKCLDCKSDFESDDFLMRCSSNYSITFNSELNRFMPIASLKKSSLKKKLYISAIVFFGVLLILLIAFAVTHPITSAGSSTTNIWMICVAFCFICLSMSGAAFFGFQYSARVDRDIAQWVQNIYEKLPTDAVSLISGRSNDEDAVIKIATDSGFTFKTLLNYALVDSEIRFFD
jgi:Zn finger protein HypA/HybF involved in hydrogenase expression